MLLLSVGIAVAAAVAAAAVASTAAVASAAVVADAGARRVALCPVLDSFKWQRF